MYTHLQTDGTGESRLNESVIQSSLDFLDANRSLDIDPSGNCVDFNTISDLPAIKKRIVPRICGPKEFVMHATELLVDRFDYLEEEIQIERWW